jgi:ketopantoate reductase
MNKRILELAKQCTTQLIDYDVGAMYNQVDHIKFAELIIQECINVIRADYVDLGTTAAVNNIEKHFGVEE